MHIVSFFYKFFSVRKYFKNVFVIITSLFLCACNTTNLQNYSSNPNDPFEKTNRKISIYGGSNEIQKNIVAKSAFKL